MFGENPLTNYFCASYQTSIFQHEPHMLDSASRVTKSTENYLLNPYQSNYDSDTFWMNYNVNTIYPEFYKTNQYCAQQNLENPHGVKSTLNQETTKNVKQNNKPDQIWRPFTPTQVKSSCLETLENEEERIHFLTSQPTPCPLLTSAPVKFGHSKTSMFTPVKKNTTVTCQNCCLSFRSNSQLNNHVRLHKGCKPYVCDYPNCSKNFARNEELTRHRRIHSGYKPYICRVCRKSFGRKDHLSKHLKTHLQASEKKVYICCVSGCGHRYTRSDALTRHKSTAHACFKFK